ncbi:aminotransferase class V-fold PLP-dependent enzyme [Nocardioides sp.]|uniref:pyridoxal phosphate-dependent decarboxylase family protein n=1 Tax=Nocardioides sp. TaxID=35761 RepID=UPI00260F9116|nr:aminotransferase class V-fold PLP-dependent enzyme [Nocardioides sp.]
MHSYDEATGAMARALAELCLERLEMDAPLDETLTPEQLLTTAGQTITAGGLGATEATRLWEEVLAPACLSVDHPRYLAFIPGAPSKAAAAFDMLVGASGIFGGSWLEASGAVYAENQALRWIADLAGLPVTAGGVFVQGGTNGNLSALVAARSAAQHRRGGRPARWSVVVTYETHSSVKHALESVMDVDVVEIPGDERGRLTGSAIRAWLATADEGQRDGVFAVVATAGSTNLGVVDDLAGIAEVAREQGWWFHVDGAYGGAGLAAPTARPLYAGIDQADSFIVDPHKWLFAPFDCCALLYRDPAQARAAHTQKASYLDILNADPGQVQWNPSDLAIQLSRRARGLPLWFSLAVNGTDAYRDAIEHTLAVARAGRALIEEADHLRLLVEPDLTVLVVERIGWSEADYAAWSTSLAHSGTAFVTPTRHRGQVCTRFAIVNPRTTIADLELVIDSMRESFAL